LLYVGLKSLPFVAEISFYNKFGEAQESEKLYEQRTINTEAAHLS
jgi:hypothetical protein